MDMDWALFATFAAPVFALIIGVAIDRFLERRPKVISYIAHTSAVNVQPPEGMPYTVHTHSVVVRNTGRKPALELRLGHYFLPNFSVYPTVPYEVRSIPGGGSEIVFQSLVPGEQLTVAYLYQPPIVWSNVNSYTKHSEGFAKVVSMLPTQQWPPSVRLLIWTLVALGATTALYGLGELAIFLL